jgi:hypothetical protein
MFAATAVTGLFGSPARPPAERQLLEQLEQLEPRHPDDRLPIGVYVLRRALPLVPADHPWRLEATQILAALRTYQRPLPSADRGWMLLSDALQHLRCWCCPPGLLPASQKLLDRPAFCFARDVVLAGLAHDWGSPLFAVRAVVPDSRVSMPDARAYIRSEVIRQQPRIPLAPLFQALEAELAGEQSAIRNRIIGANVFVPLPAHMIWRMASSTKPYVEGVLAALRCDWRLGVVILPDGTQLSFAVHEEDLRQWFGDRLHDLLAEQQPPTGHIEIHDASNSQIAVNSPWAHQSSVTNATPAVSPASDSRPVDATDTGAASKPQGPQDCANPRAGIDSPISQPEELLAPKAQPTADAEGRLLATVLMLVEGAGALLSKTAFCEHAPHLFKCTPFHAATKIWRRVPKLLRAHGGPPKPEDQEKIDKGTAILTGPILNGLRNR